MQDTVDLLVIGGGINGTGIARDAAGRGLSVLLCEKDDLAEGTSSRSGKLIHGGLRYLEYYEFRLVREALIEREVLLNSAAHIIWPMRFVLPHSPTDRPAWLIRLGLWLYDNIGGRKKLPGTRRLDLRRDPEGIPLREEFTKAFEYSDCWVDDSRLVVLNAIDAAEHGAQIYTRTACVSAVREQSRWRVELHDTASGAKKEVFARALVNAAGPWVERIVHSVAQIESKRTVRLVKGSHIIVPKFWQGQQAYLIQNDDMRVIFINPYEGDKALIGTTDISYDGAPEDVAADEIEIDYLIKAVNRYFKSTLRRDDVLQCISGVRPLFDDGKGNPSAVTRDYVFDLDTKYGAPLLSIFGGKITTYRKLAEHAMNHLSDTFPKMGLTWTTNGVLPGGDFEHADFDKFFSKVQSDFPWLPENLCRHYSRLYGTRLYTLLGAARCMDDLGVHFGSLLYEVEANYLVDNEWAQTPDDILMRRTKHGMHMSKTEIKHFRGWQKNDVSTNT